MKTFNRKQEKFSIVKPAADDTILYENNKLSAENGAHEKIYSEIDEDNLYEIDNINLDVNKEKK